MRTVSVDLDQSEEERGGDGPGVVWRLPPSLTEFAFCDSMIDPRPPPRVYASGLVSVEVNPGWTDADLRLVLASNPGLTSLRSFALDMQPETVAELQRRTALRSLQQSGPQPVPRDLFAGLVCLTQLRELELKLPADAAADVAAVLGALPELEYAELCSQESKDQCEFKAKSESKATSETKLSPPAVGCTLRHLAALRLELADDSLALLSLPALTSLRLAGANVQFVDFAAALRSCVALRTLMIAHCEFLSDASLERALPLLSSLAHLRLEQCPRVTAAAVVSIGERALAPKLVQLRVLQCFSHQDASPLTFAALKQLLVACPSLEVLLINLPGAVSKEFGQYLQTRAPLLLNHYSFR